MQYADQPGRRCRNHHSLLLLLAVFLCVASAGNPGVPVPGAGAGHKGEEGKPCAPPCTPAASNSPATSSSRGAFAAFQADLVWGGGLFREGFTASELRAGMELYLDLYLPAGSRLTSGLKITEPSLFSSTLNALVEAVPGTVLAGCRSQMGVAPKLVDVNPSKYSDGRQLRLTFSPCSELPSAQASREVTEPTPVGLYIPAETMSAYFTILYQQEAVGGDFCCANDPKKALLGATGFNKGCGNVLRAPLKVPGTGEMVPEPGDARVGTLLGSTSWEETDVRTKQYTFLLPESEKKTAFDVGLVTPYLDLGQTPTPTYFLSLYGTNVTRVVAYKLISAAAADGYASSGTGCEELNSTDCIYPLYAYRLQVHFNSHERSYYVCVTEDDGETWTRLARRIDRSDRAVYDTHAPATAAPTAAPDTHAPDTHTPDTPAPACSAGGPCDDTKSTCCPGGYHCEAKVCRPVPILQKTDVPETQAPDTPAPKSGKTPAPEETGNVCARYSSEGEACSEEDCCSAGLSCVDGNSGDGSGGSNATITAGVCLNETAAADPTTAAPAGDVKLETPAPQTHTPATATPAASPAPVTVPHAEEPPVGPEGLYSTCATPVVLSTLPPRPQVGLETMLKATVLERTREEAEAASADDAALTAAGKKPRARFSMEHLSVGQNVQVLAFLVDDAKAGGTTDADEEAKWCRGGKLTAQGIVVTSGKGGVLAFRSLMVAAPGLYGLCVAVTSPTHGPLVSRLRGGDVRVEEPIVVSDRTAEQYCDADPAAGTTEPLVFDGRRHNASGVRWERGYYRTTRRASLVLEDQVLFSATKDLIELHSLTLIGESLLMLPFARVVVTGRLTIRASARTSTAYPELRRGLEPQNVFLRSGVVLAAGAVAEIGGGGLPLAVQMFALPSFLNPNEADPHLESLGSLRIGGGVRFYQTPGSSEAFHTWGLEGGAAGRGRVSSSGLVTFAGGSGPASTAASRAVDMPALTLSMSCGKGAEGVQLESGADVRIRTLVADGPSGRRAPAVECPVLRVAPGATLRLSSGVATLAMTAAVAGGGAIVFDQNPPPPSGEAGPQKVVFSFVKPVVFVGGGDGNGTAPAAAAAAAAVAPVGGRLPPDASRGSVTLFCSAGNRVEFLDRGVLLRGSLDATLGCAGPVTLAAAAGSAAAARGGVVAAEKDVSLDLRRGTLFLISPEAAATRRLAAAAEAHLLGASAPATTAEEVDEAATDNVYYTGLFDGVIDAEVAALRKEEALVGGSGTIEGYGFKASLCASFLLSAGALSWELEGFNVGPDMFGMPPNSAVPVLPPVPAQTFVMKLHGVSRLTAPPCAVQTLQTGTGGCAHCSGGDYVLELGPQANVTCELAQEPLHPGPSTVRIGPGKSRGTDADPVDPAHAGAGAGDQRHVVLVPVYMKVRGGSLVNAVSDAHLYFAAGSEWAVGNGGGVTSINKAQGVLFAGKTVVSCAGGDAAAAAAAAASSDGGPAVCRLSGGQGGVLTAQAVFLPHGSTVLRGAACIDAEGGSVVQANAEVRVVHAAYTGGAAVDDEGDHSGEAPCTFEGKPNALRVETGGVVDARVWTGQSSLRMHGCLETEADSLVLLGYARGGRTCAGAVTVAGGDLILPPDAAGTPCPLAVAPTVEAAAVSKSLSLHPSPVDQEWPFVDLLDGKVVRSGGGDGSGSEVDVLRIPLLDDTEADLALHNQTYVSLAVRHIEGRRRPHGLVLVRVFRGTGIGTGEHILAGAAILAAAAAAVAALCRLARRGAPAPWRPPPFPLPTPPTLRLLDDAGAVATHGGRPGAARFMVLAATFQYLVVPGMYWVLAFPPGAGVALADAGVGDALVRFASGVLQGGCASTRDGVLAALSALCVCGVLGFAAVAFVAVEGRWWCRWTPFANDAGGAAAWRRRLLRATRLGGPATLRFLRLACGLLGLAQLPLSLLLLRNVPHLWRVGAARAQVQGEELSFTTDACGGDAAAKALAWLSLAAAAALPVALQLFGVWGGVVAAGGHGHGHRGGSKVVLLGHPDPPLRCRRVGGGGGKGEEYGGYGYDDVDANDDACAFYAVELPAWYNVGREGDVYQSWRQGAVFVFALLGVWVTQWGTADAPLVYLVLFVAFHGVFAAWTAAAAWARLGTVVLPTPYANLNTAAALGHLLPLTAAVPTLVSTALRGGYYVRASPCYHGYPDGLRWAYTCVLAAGAGVCAVGLLWALFLRGSGVSSEGGAPKEGSAAAAGADATLPLPPPPPSKGAAGSPAAREAAAKAASVARAAAQRRAAAGGPPEVRATAAHFEATHRREVYEQLVLRERCFMRGFYISTLAGRQEALDARAVGAGSGGDGGGVDAGVELQPFCSGALDSPLLSNEYHNPQAHDVPPAASTVSAAGSSSDDGPPPSSDDAANAEVYACLQKGRRLGKGSYGCVYVGVLSGGGLVAVKEIELPASSGGGGGERVRREVRKVQREVDFLRRLRHPNIVAYKACYVDYASNTVNLVMEYAVGGSLTGLVRACAARLPEPVLAAYLAQVVEGLSFLHGRGVVHRDVKGENVLLDATGVVKLADFGCATQLHSVGACETFIGTPYWMPPEVIQNKGCNASADVWSVGCTAVEALNGGRPPWREFDSVFAALHHISNSDEAPNNLPEGVSQAAMDFVATCCNRKADGRPTAEV